MGKKSHKIKMNYRQTQHSSKDEFLSKIVLEAINVFFSEIFDLSLLKTNILVFTLSIEQHSKLLIFARSSFFSKYII